MDLVLSDIPEAACKVLPTIADHAVVQTELNLQIPESAPLRRQVWNFARVDWQRLEEELGEVDWQAISVMSSDEGAAWMTERILEKTDKCIGRKMVTTPKSTHPWLNDRVMGEVSAKIAAEGTVNEQAAAKQCSATILEEHGAWERRNAGHEGWLQGMVG